MSTITLGPFDFGRLVNAAERVLDRLLRATAALEASGVPYAVVGGNAVANWISRVDDSLVRFTRDVDLLLERSALPAATEAFLQAGFLYRHTAGMDVFLDGPDTNVADAVHILFANEKVLAADPLPNPSINEVVQGAAYRVLTLEALVRMKLVSDRNKDRTHLDDLIDAGLIDRSWITKLPSPLDERLRELFDRHSPPLHTDQPT